MGFKADTTIWLCNDIVKCGLYKYWLKMNKEKVLLPSQLVVCESLLQNWLATLTIKPPCPT